MGGKVAMKRIIKIVKAFYFMYPSIWLPLPFLFIIMIFISTMLCYGTTRMTVNYVNEGTTMGLGGFFMQILNMINLSNIFVFTSQIITTRNNYTGNMDSFLIQSPLLKKDIYNMKFGILQIVSIPFLIVVINVIIVNIFVSTGNYISAYSGFLVLIYCIWTITLSVLICLSSLGVKKYKATLFLGITLLLVIFLFLISIPYSQPTSIVNEQNMYNELGPMLSPVLKACTHIGGFIGIIIILVSILISYFFSCILPLKISNKGAY